MKPAFLYFSASPIQKIKLSRNLLLFWKPVRTLHHHHHTMFSIFFTSADSDHSLSRPGSSSAMSQTDYPKRFIPRDSYGTPLLNPMEIEVREQLIAQLDTDALYDYWFAKLQHLEWIQTSPPHWLQIKLKRAKHTSHLDGMEDLLMEMIKTARDIHACYESYKHVVTTYQIRDEAFMRRENEQSEMWQDLLQDVTDRLEDLYLLIMGPHEDDSLPLVVYKNIAYARSWLGVAWKNQLQNSVFLKLLFLEPDHTFGPLRVKEPVKSAQASSESLGFTLERMSTTDSEQSLDSMDFLAPTMSELSGIEEAKTMLKRSRSALSFLGRFGRRKKS